MRRSFWLLSMILVCLVGSPVNAAETLVLDPFTDGGVTVGADPLDVAWSTSATNALLTVVEDSLLDPDMPYRAGDFLIANTSVDQKDDYIGFALPSNIVLDVGQALQLTYRLRFHGGLPRADASRTGVSIAYRTSGTTPWSAANNREYCAFTSFGTNGMVGSIRRSVDAQFLNTGEVLAGNTMCVNLGTDTVGTVFLEVARVDTNSIRVRYKLNGGATQEATDVNATNATFWTFNRVFYRYRRATTQPLESMRLDDVQVDWVAVDTNPPVYEAKTYFVSPSGSDANDGMGADTPFKTIGRAAAVALPGDTVRIRAGTYRETVTPAASGMPDAPISFVAYETNGVRDEVIVSGFDVLTPGVGGVGTWEPDEGSVYRIQLSGGLGFTGATDAGQNLFLVDGEAVVEARWPNVGRAVDFDYRNMAWSEGGTVDVSSAGAQLPYGGTNFYTGTYWDNELPGSEADAWAGAHIDLAPHKAWWHRNGVVTGSVPGSIAFRYKYNIGWPGIDEATAPDAYFLWGKRIALDAENECFYDVTGNSGSTNILYLWCPGGGSPSGRVVEIRQRVLALNVAACSNIVVRGLALLGAGVECGSGSRAVTLDDVTVQYGAYNMNLLVDTPSAIKLDGIGHAVRNCTVSDNFGYGILDKGISNTVENCVVLNCSTHSIGTDNAQQCRIRNNTTAWGGNTCISISAPRSEYVSNHVYAAGMRITDIAAMNTWDSGDGWGTQIAWNWVHGNHARYDASLGWNGGQGIRLDSGKAPDGCSNFRIHHNVVWDVNPGTCIVAWRLTTNQLNYGDSKVGIYNNTMGQTLTLAGDGSAAGTDIRNNIAIEFDDGGRSLTGATISNNVFLMNAPEGNREADPQFLAGWRSDLQLQPISPAIDYGDVISGIGDTWEGSAPDAGALEYGKGPWVPGAKILERQVGNLAIEAVHSRTGSVRYVVSGLPVGRSLPSSFRIMVGGCTSGPPAHTFVFSDMTASAAFAVDTGSMSGSQPVSFALNGTDFVDTGKHVTLPTTYLDNGNPAAGVYLSPTNGGAWVTLSGGGLFGSAEWLSAVTITNQGSDELTQKPVPLLMDTTQLIAAGRMRADGRGVRFVDSSGAVAFDHWIESGLNTDHTLVWLRIREGSAAADSLSLEDISIYMATRTDSDADMGNFAVLTNEYPEVVLPTLRMWLKANVVDGAVTNGSVVTNWTDRSGWNNAGWQTNSPGAEPNVALDIVGGLPAIDFDGDDYMWVGHAFEGSTGTFVGVYFNPDPGSTTYQRLYSAAPDGLADYTGQGAAGYTEYIGGTSVPHTVASMFRNSVANTNVNMRNFTIGAHCFNHGSRYKGYLSELLGFREALTTAQKDNLKRYLERKYGMTGQGRGALANEMPIPPVVVTVNGVAATNVEIVSSSEIRFFVPGVNPTNTTPMAYDIVLQLPGGDTAVLTNGVWYYADEFERWQIENFAVPGTNQLVGEAADVDDADDDGMDNGREYVAGTQPTNGASVFRIVTLTNGVSSVGIAFTTVTGRYYQVQHGDNLGESIDWTPLVNREGNGQTVEIEDVDDDPVRFYRVRVRTTPWE